MTETNQLQAETHPLSKMNSSFFLISVGGNNRKVFYLFSPNKISQINSNQYKSLQNQTM